MNVDVTLRRSRCDMAFDLESIFTISRETSSAHMNKDCSKVVSLFLIIAHILISIIRHYLNLCRYINTSDSLSLL